MKIVACNGSPRKEWNTATLLQHVLNGAASVGAQTSMHHLYDYTFTGCRSCMLCKRKGLSGKRQCAMKDELTPLLEEIAGADALVMGSPVYFYGETGVFRCFMERLLFPWLSYEKDVASYYTGKFPCALIYTMNITEKEMEGNRSGLPEWLKLDTVKVAPHFFTRVFGHCETLLCTDTMQVEDYDAYAMSKYDAEAKQRGRDTRFVEDCAKATALGRRLCGWK